MVAQLQQVQQSNVIDLAAKRQLANKFKGNAHAEYQSEKNKILAITIGDIFTFCEMHQLPKPLTRFSTSGSFEQVLPISSVSKFLNMEEDIIRSLFTMSFHEKYNAAIDLVHGTLFNWCFWGCKYEVGEWLLSAPAVALIVLSRSNRNKNSIIYKFKSAFGFNPTKSRNLWWYQEWLQNEYQKQLVDYKYEVLNYITTNNVDRFIADTSLVSSVNAESKQVIKQIMLGFGFKRTYRNGQYGWLSPAITTSPELPF